MSLYVSLHTSDAIASGVALNFPEAETQPIYAHPTDEGPERPSPPSISEGESDRYSCGKERDSDHDALRISRGGFLSVDEG